MQDNDPIRRNPDVSGYMPKEFDRLLDSIIGTPGTTHTRESTVTTVPLMGIGGARTFIVQTYRQRELLPPSEQENPDAPNPDESYGPAKDTIFLQCIGADGSFRIALPSAVANIVARQRESLNTKSRKKAAKKVAAFRKATGYKYNTKGLEAARKARKAGRKK